MLVATVDVRKASIRRPVGMSNVLIIESSDVVMSHRESDEKAYVVIVMRPEQHVTRADLQRPEHVRRIHRTLELFCESQYRRDAQRGHRMSQQVNRCLAGE